jgi:hypothetical protein
MQVYHFEGAVIASHPDDQAVPEGAYGDARLLIAPEGVEIGVSSEGAPVIPSDLTTLRAIALATVSAWKRLAQDGGYEYSGKRIDSDSRSVQAIGHAVQMAQVSLSQGRDLKLPWVAADNTTIALDAQGIIGLGVAGFQHFAACHERALVHKEAVRAAKDVESVREVLRAIGAW